MKTKKMYLLMSIPMLLCSCDGANGQLKKESYYDEDGKLAITDTYTYKDGKLSEVVEEVYQLDGIQKGKTEINYFDGSFGSEGIYSMFNAKTNEWEIYGKTVKACDSNGNEVSSVDFKYQDGKYSEYILKISVYNDNNLLIKNELYFKDGDDFVCDTRVTYEYDSEKRLTKENTYTTFMYDELNFDGYFAYTYNTEGKVEKKTEYNANGEMIGYTTYSYSDNTSTEIFTRIEDDKTESQRTKTIITYDKKDRKTKEEDFYFDEETGSFASSGYTIYEY